MIHCHRMEKSYRLVTLKSKVGKKAFRSQKIYCLKYVAREVELNSHGDSKLHYFSATRHV